MFWVEVFGPDRRWRQYGELFWSYNVAYCFWDRLPHANEYVNIYERRQMRKRTRKHKCQRMHACPEHCLACCPELAMWLISGHQRLEHEARERGMVQIAMYVAHTERN